jgi:hypothetical protein
MKTAKQFSRQRTRHTFLLPAPADASCNAPCRLRGHDQPLSAHATLSVPALLAEHPLRVIPMQDRDSVVSIPHGIDLLLHMLPAAFFLPPKRTPKASSIRADGPAQNRVAGGHFTVSAISSAVASTSEGRKPFGRRRNAAEIGGSLSSRAQEKDRESVSVRGTDFYSFFMPTTRPKDPGGIPRVPSSVLGKRTSHSAPEKQPDAATSATPPGSRCLRPCKPAVQSAVSACRRFPDQESPPAALLQPMFLSDEEPHPSSSFGLRRDESGMLPHLAPRRSKCSAVVYVDCAALESLPDLLAPAAARRRALAVMLHEHHREPDKLDAPARCAGTTKLVWTAHHRTSCPQGTAPACRPPEGRHAARSRLPVLAGSGSHPASRCVHLGWRPHVVCVNQAAGIVAMFPFHAPAVPFIAASIPPRLPNPSSLPLPAAFCGRVQRLCRSPRPQYAVPYSSINLTENQTKTP